MGDMLGAERSEELRLSQSLKELYKSLNNHEVTVGEFVDALGEKGFGILLLVFALPSMIPIMSTGIATPLGFVIAFLGAQMAAGKSKPWLPKKARSIKMKSEHAKKMIDWMLKFSSNIERFICPRMGFVIHKIGERIMGILICILALIMALPFPLTNTIPALIIFLIGIGLTESDGLVCLVGSILAGISNMLYGYVFFLFLLYGKIAVMGFSSWLKHFF